MQVLKPEVRRLVLWVLVGLVLVSGALSFVTIGSRIIGMGALPPPPEPPQLYEKPNVTITSPAPGATLADGEAVTFTADANDDNAINTVEFYVDGTRIATDDTEPYGTTWTATEGVHTLRVTAVDADGASANTSITVSVDFACEGCAYNGTCIATMERHPTEDKLCIDGSFVSLPDDPDDTCNGCETADGTCIAPGETHPSDDRICEDGSFVEPPCDGCELDGTCYQPGAPHPSDTTKTCRNGTFQLAPCDGCRLNNTCIQDGTQHPTEDKLCIDGSFVDLPDEPADTCNGCTLNGTCYDNGSNHPSDDRICEDGSFVEPPCDGCELDGTCYQPGASHPSDDRICKNGSFVEPPCQGCRYNGTCYANGSDHPTRTEVCMDGTFVTDPAIADCDGCVYERTCYDEATKHPTEDKACFGGGWVTLPDDPAGANETNQSDDRDDDQDGEDQDDGGDDTTQQPTPVTITLATPKDGGRYAAHNVPITLNFQPRPDEARIYVDDELEISLTSPPFSHMLDTEPGEHTLRVEADLDNQTTTKTVTFRAKNAVAFNNDKQRYRTGDRITLDTTGDGRFMFLVNGKFHSYVNAPEFTVRGLPDGQHTLEAQAIVNDERVVADAIDIDVEQGSDVVEETTDRVTDTNRAVLDFEGTIYRLNLTFTDNTTTDVTVKEMLDGDDFDGDVFRYAELNAGTASGDVYFRVPTLWFDHAGHDRDDLTLFRNHDGWERLDATIIGENEDYTYYKAPTPGFSPFVIGTGDDPAEDDETSTDATEDDQVERDGGGGGGLPWPSGPNIEAYMESMLFSVDAGEDRVLSIGSGTGVREVRFRAASKLPHAKFAVKRLKEHDLASAIKGRVYTILDIETTADVERADLIVSVNERWLRENDIEIDAIRVYRHDGSWKQLPTEPIATTPYGQIYKATTQSFSYFAIGTGQTAPPPNDTQSDDAPEDTGSDDGATVQPEDDQPSDAEQVPGNDAQPPRVERASDVSWWVYLAPLILFISLGGLGLLFMTEPDLGLDDAQLKKLRNYVDRNKHMPRDALKQKMLDKGWPEDVITYVLNDRL